MRLSMRTAVIFLVLLAAILVGACNRKSGSPSSAVSSAGPGECRVTLGDRRVSFIPPPNLKQLSKDQIAASKFSKKPPDYLFANDAQSVTVGVASNLIELKPEELDDYVYANHRLISMGIPDVEFLAEEIVTIN